MSDKHHDRKRDSYIPEFNPNVEAIKTKDDRIEALECALHNEKNLHLAYEQYVSDYNVAQKRISSLTDKIYQLQTKIDKLQKGVK